MSKHIFEETLNGQHYEVQLGWDKPTQAYYGMIVGWIQDTDCENCGYFDDLLWSSIFMRTCTPTLETIEKEISERGFTIPDGLLDNVKNNRLRNAVNEYTFYENNALNNKTAPHPETLPLSMTYSL